MLSVWHILFPVIDSPSVRVVLPQGIR